MKKGQEPAFPIFLQEGLSHNSHVDCGMSTRLYLAGMAMQGLLSALQGIKTRSEFVDMINKTALQYADGLIKMEEETK